MTRPGTRPVDALGGWSGLLLSAVPPALLVVVDSVAGLAPALAVATAVAAAVCAVRVRQGHAVGPAAGGLVGTAISAVIAWWTGTAAGFFALDLVWYLVAGAALFGSVVVPPPAGRDPLAAGARWACAGGGAGSARSRDGGVGGGVRGPVRGAGVAAGRPAARLAGGREGRDGSATDGGGRGRHRVGRRRSTRYQRVFSRTTAELERENTTGQPPSPRARSAARSPRDHR